MNRYNLGFGNFGPLEQCKDGKYMLAEEVLPILDAAALQVETAKETEAEVLRRRDWKPLYNALAKDYNLLIQKYKKMQNKMEILLVTLALITALAPLAVLYLVRCV